MDDSARLDPCIRCLIVDDEAPARRRMASLLEGFDDLRVVGIASDAHSVPELISDSSPDLILLDVQMPGLSGVDLATCLPTPIQVVFCTAHDQYAVRAFEIDAVDYLLKPISARRLESALARVRARIERPLPACPQATYKVAARSRGRTQWVPAESIEAFVARDKYTVFELDGEEFILEDSLRALEVRLSRVGFVRVHRTALVNLRYVCAIERAGRSAVLELRSGATVPVARRSVHELRRELNVEVIG